MESSLKESLAIAQQIEINASRERVWAVLSNLAAHDSWNPIFRIDEAPSSLKTGAQACLRAAPGTSHERIFTVEIVQVTVAAALAWRGGEPGVLEGIHRFDLLKQGPQQTRLVNSEAFSGAIAADVLQVSRAALEAEFAAFNQALKNRVEATCR